MYYYFKCILIKFFHGSALFANSTIFILGALGLKYFHGWPLKFTESVKILLMVHVYNWSSINFIIIIISSSSSSNNIIIIMLFKKLYKKFKGNYDNFEDIMVLFQMIYVRKIWQICLQNDKC